MNHRHQRTSSQAADGPALFRLEQATLRVGARQLLAGTTWTLHAGQNWVILGENGSGKTTLAGTLTGETRVVAGRRWVDRKRLDPSTVRVVSFESQQRLIARDESQDDARCFAQQILRGTSVRTVLAKAHAAGGGDRTVLETWMRRAGLWDWRDRPVRHLSSGEMRQVMIARALLDTPRLLIIDEPFDGLDPSARRGLAAILSRLMAGGLQIVLITHHQDEILPEITHYLMLRAGLVVEQGPWRPQGRVQKPQRREAGPEGAAGLAGGKTRADDMLPEKTSRGLIRMCEVTVAYDGRRVLDRVNWCVRPGENWAICGPNGAGKSTLLQLVCGDHPQAYANEIYLFGRRRGSGETIWDVKRPLGMVSNTLQIRYRKPLDGLGVILSGYFDSVGLYRQVHAEQVATARRLAARFAVGHLLDSDFRKMSNGERRMLLIARAMIKQPVLLLLDEPCQGLDSTNRRCLLAMLDTILATSPTQLLYVSHRSDEIPAGTTHELHLALDGTYRILRRHHR